MVDVSEPRTLLAVMVGAGNLAHEEHVKALNRRARQLDEDATFSLRQFDRWLAGQVERPRPATRRVLEDYFARPIDALLAPPAVGPLAIRQAAPQLEVSARWDLESLAMAAAHESSEHASFASTRVEDTSVEQLQERIYAAARRHATAAPLEIFGELVRVRNHAYALAERTKRPHQLADLYVVAGQACAMLAELSFDLGYPDAAGEQVRSALAYGQIAEHSSLCAFALAVQSTIAFWSGEPTRGVRLAGDGLEYRNTGTAAVRLRAVEARSWALKGAYDKTRDSLVAAEAAREDSGSDPMLDEIGGEFAFGPARVAFCSASAYLALEDGEAAARSAQRALDLCVHAPDHEQSFRDECGARLDLVAAMMLQGDLTGAEQTMRPVLDLPPTQRTARLAHRVRALRAIANKPAHRETVAARNLGDMVEDFVSDTAQKALPPGIG